MPCDEGPERCDETPPHALLSEAPSKSPKTPRSSWFASSAEEFRKQLTSSAQKLAEHADGSILGSAEEIRKQLATSAQKLAEQGDGGLLSSAEEIRKQFATSAQKLAEQGDAAQEEIRKQFATSAQKLAEQGDAAQEEIRKQFATSAQKLAEQGDGVITSAEEIRKQFATSAQKLAEQTDGGLQSFIAGAGSAKTSVDEGLQSLGDSLRASASSLTGSLDPGLVLRTRSGAEESLRQFEAEAAALAVPGAQLEAALRAWQRRLAEDDEQADGRLAAPALGALLRSRGLQAAVQAIVASSGQRVAVLHRAAEVARRGEDASALAAPTREDAAGELLSELLGRAAAADQPAPGALLALLHSAAQAAGDHAGEPAEADLRWACQLLEAAILEGSESDATRGTRLCEAADSALRAAEEAAAAAPTGSAAQKAATVDPEVGSEVWACWPGDGIWYRAHVRKVLSKKGRVRVAWMQEQASQAANGAVAGECLPIDAASDQAMSEVSLASIVPVAGTIRRPPPAPSEAQDTPAWEDRLKAVEAHSCHARELRQLADQLGAHARWCAAAPAEATASQLHSTADQLMKIRTEAEEKVRALQPASGGEAEVLLPEWHGGHVFGAAEKLVSKTAGATQDLEAVRQQRLSHLEQLQALRLRHLEAEEQLRRAAEELREAETKQTQMDAKEKQLQAELSELAAQAALQSTTQEPLPAKRERLLSESIQVSRELEEQLAVRAEAVSKAVEQLGGGRGCEALQSAARRTAAAREASDKARRAELGELLADWQERVWGPSAASLRGSQASALREAHTQALAVVEGVLREPGLDAPASDDAPAGPAEAFEGLLGLEDRSRQAAAAASRRAYKEMRSRLRESLARMAELEASSGSAGGLLQLEHVPPLDPGGRIAHDPEQTSGAQLLDMWMRSPVSMQDGM